MGVFTMQVQLDKFSDLCYIFPFTYNFTCELKQSNRLSYLTYATQKKVAFHDY